MFGYRHSARQVQRYSTCQYSVLSLNGGLARCAENPGTVPRTGGSLLHRVTDMGVLNKPTSRFEPIHQTANPQPNLSSFARPGRIKNNNKKPLSEACFRACHPPNRCRQAILVQNGAQGGCRAGSMAMT